MLQDQTPDEPEQMRMEEEKLGGFSNTLGSAEVGGPVSGSISDSFDTGGVTNGHGIPSPQSDSPIALEENAKVILRKRYLRKDDQGNPLEEPEDLFRRVARAISQGEKEQDRNLWEDRFFGLLTSLKFLPNSPTLVNAGTGRGCLSACFVVSPDDTMDSIMQVAHDAAMIEKWGGGIGFGFSKLRPKNDKISSGRLRRP